MATHGPSVAIAAFTVDALGPRTIEIAAAPRVRAASLLKPLLAWAAAKQEWCSHNAAVWRKLARAAVTFSDNNATAELWSRAGDEQLLAALNDLLVTTWRIDEGDEHPALRISVTAIEVAQAYAGLALDNSPAASEVRQWMCEVPSEQTFGLRAVARDALAATEDAVGVKCGWFGGERAHAVVAAQAEDRSLGAVVLTDRVADAATSDAAMAASGDDLRLLAVHEKVAGEELRREVRRALLRAKTL